jgi:YVTN family beta-propeller protein
MPLRLNWAPMPTLSWCICMPPSPRRMTAAAPKTADAVPSRSTTIALTPDERFVVVVNREANSVSIIKVKNAQGNDVSNKIAEIPVGEEPRCVAIHPSDQAAYVTNAVSGTVSVVDLKQHTQVTELRVGTEPRGCALTPEGSLLYVANHTEGTVSIIDTSHLRPWPGWRTRTSALFGSHSAGHP